jgi:hypothetical protein
LDKQLNDNKDMIKEEEKMLKRIRSLSFKKPTTDSNNNNNNTNKRTSTRSTHTNNNKDENDDDEIDSDDDDNTDDDEDNENPLHRKQVHLTEAYDGNHVVNLMEENYIGIILRGYDLKHQQIHSISIGVMGSSRLRHLSLHSCAIRDDDVRLLCNALQANSTLRNLDLQRNEISDIGALELGNVLRSSASLEIIKLSYNKIRNKGGRYVLEGLTDNEMIIELELKGNPITDVNIVEQIHKLIKRNIRRIDRKFRAKSAIDTLERISIGKDGIVLEVDNPVFALPDGQIIENLGT